jgi:hypothetical protein
LVGIEPEIVKRAEANRVRVLISRKRFRAPGNGACVLGNVPWCGAIAEVSLRAIMRKTRVLRRRMKLDVSHIDSSSYRHAERLNRAIEVLVIERVLIVPDTGIWSSHFVTHEPDTIDSRSRFDLVYRGAGPRLNGGLLPHRQTNL